jgi:hypothetical protein
VWDVQRVSMATRQDSPAARHAARMGEACLALGDFADVVLINGPVTVVSPDAVDDAVADRLARVSAIDGRRAPGAAYLQLVPSSIQAWWSDAELASNRHATAAGWADGVCHLEASNDWNLHAESFYGQRPVDGKVFERLIRHDVAVMNNAVRIHVSSAPTDPPSPSYVDSRALAPVAPGHAGAGGCPLHGECARPPGILSDKDLSQPALQ